MSSDYWEEKRAGLKQALAAWAILLVLITALQFLGPLWQDQSFFEVTKSANIQP